MVIDSQFLWAVVLGVYVMALLLLTKIPYDRMIAHGMDPMRAVYYNRKIVHMLGAGVASLFVPLIFVDLIYPLVAGLLFSLLTWATHALGLRMFWFQIEENRNDFKFALAWLGSVTVLWWLLGNPWLAILPALFVAFGDGVTGVARNFVVRKRSKHPIGNVFMFLVCAPMGWIIGNLAEPGIPEWGLLAAILATLVERYEIGVIDDNILIALVATLTLLAGAQIGPVF